MSAPSVSPQDSTESPGRPDSSHKRRWKRLLLKFGFSLLVAALALKIGDVVLGRVRHTSQRHWLRLSPNASVRHVSTEFDYVFHTNALGFRGGDVPFEKPPGTSRIVVLGDSFVAGVGVPDDAVFTVRLEKLLRKQKPGTQVVNLGRAGSSTIRECDIYRRFGRRFHPDVVVLVFFLGNDLAEITEEMTDEEIADWKPPGFLRGWAYTILPNLYQELALLRQSSRSRRELREMPQPQLLARLREEAVRRGRDPDWAERRFFAVPRDVRTAAEAGRFPLMRLMHACLDPQRRRRSLNPDDAYFETAWPRVTRQLQRLKSLVAEDGATLKIVALPESVQVDAKAARFNRRIGFEIDDRWASGTCRVESALRRWARTNEVDYLNLTDRFREGAGGYYYIWDRHLNPSGHKLMADALGGWLNGHN